MNIVAPRIHQRIEIPIGAHPLVVTVGDVARQAHGAAMVQHEDTVVIATACMNVDSERGEDFIPLLCDYRENTYAAGKFPGGFIKREGKPSEKEILTSRLIDRSVRPLFPKGYRWDTQVIVSVYSASPLYDPDVAALNAAAMALLFSPIPFSEAVVGVRVAEVDGQFVINPTLEVLHKSPLSLFVSGTVHGIVMVEAGASEYPEDRMAEALLLAQRVIQEQAERILEVYRQTGLEADKPKVEPPVVPEELMAEVRARFGERMRAALQTPGKQASHRAVEALLEEALAEVPEEDEERQQAVKRALDQLKRDIVRRMILEEGLRPDGRGMTEIRPIRIEVGLLPRTHGSALFTRGETQALVTCTLGTAEDAQKIEELTGESFKRFMLHYNFPPFSVGEVSPLRAPSRREIGHGALAERALLPVIPPEEQFPYTIRVVSEILESNGSSSMATVCGGSLALMDAGVPIRTPVAGIAMGLFTDQGRYRILTDIAGEEDHTGDMDFKVAGTRTGITALQMDIKVPALSADVLREALYQAREARLFILDRMAEVLPAPRPDISPLAPRLVVTYIPTDKIATLIGPGGKMVKSIIEKTGVKIDIRDDGRVFIAGDTAEACEAALKMVRDVTADVEKGRTYLGKVTRITDFGAFVEILPGIVGLLHKSEMAPYPVRDVREIIQGEGQEILVKVLDVEDNRIRLSHRDFAPPRPARPERPRPGGPSRERPEQRRRRPPYTRPHRT
jgi:polyribonucleotide nucleotidyltransferase